MLKGAVELVSSNGRVFVGDVRHHGLLHLFHSSVQLAHAPESLSLGQLKNRINSAVAREKELVIDPGLFLALQNHVPRVGSVEVLLKRGRSDNELTRYRYDVVLHVGGIATPAVQET